MRGEETSTAYFHPAALQIAGLIGDDGADGIDVRLLANQLPPKPVVVAPGIVLQKNWGLIAAGDQHILGAVIIKVADSQSACRHHALKHRSRFTAHILESGVRLVKQTEWLAVGDARV